MKYLDKDGKPTDNIIFARVIRAKTVSMPVRKWCSKFEMMHDLRVKGCGFAICKTELCWLELYPQHRCKFRLTLPKD